MREIDEFPDDESDIENQSTRVKDYEEHLITPEERDEIIRKFNAKESDMDESTTSEELPEEDRDLSLCDELLNDTNYEELMKRDPRLYSDEDLTWKEIGKKFGIKSNPFGVDNIKRYPIDHDIFRDFWKEASRDVEDDTKDAQKEIDPEEVRRLYVEDGLSLKKIGEHYGLKTGKQIRRILRDEGVEIRKGGFQEIQIDPEEAYRLYFEEKWDLKNVAAHFGCKSTDPIHRVFREQGWKTRYQETYEKEIDPEEVFTLYEEGLSLKKIGEYFGVSNGPIRRIFEEHDMEYGQEVQVDLDTLYELYFIQGLPKDEVCERMGISKKPFDRIFDEQGWEKRPAGFLSLEIDLDEVKRLYYEEELTIKETAEELQVSSNTLTRFLKKHQMEIRTYPSKIELDYDEFSRLYYEEELPMTEICSRLEVTYHTVERFMEEQNFEKRIIQTVKEIQDEMFGESCVSCGKPREVIHRKDGKPHKRSVTWTKKSLQTLNPDDWAALCRNCHKITHGLMNSFNYKWDDIETILKKLAEDRLP